jgi:hypothetical protein
MNRILVMLLVCALAGALTACGIVVITSGKHEATRGGACRSKGPCYGRESTNSKAMVANWSGDACDEVLYSAKESHHQSSWSAKTDPDPRHQVLLASCARYKVRIDNHTGYPRMEEQRAKVARLAIETTHAAFDDRTFDHVEAALLVWSCAQTPTCYSAGKERQYGSGVPTDRGAVLGIAGLYALHLDFDALESALVGMNLPDGVAPAFLAIAHDASSKIIADIAELPADVRPVFVEIPKLVYTERQDYFGENAVHYSELDALLDSTRAARESSQAEPGLARALLALRSAYMAKCGKRACQLHPFYEEVTRELILVYAALNNVAAVRAEQETFRSQGQSVPGLAQTIYLRQQPLAVAGRDAFEKKKRALAEGMDEATATSLLGGVAPVRYTHTSLVRPEMSWPDYAKVLGGKWSPPMSGYVASVKTQDEVATVRFKSTSHKVDVPYDCRRTRRLERIHSDGRLEYEQVCKWKKKTETTAGPDPIEIPASEAGAIKKGDLLSAVLGSGRRGWVRRVLRGDMIVQVRGDPVQPELVPKRRK